MEYRNALSRKARAIAQSRMASSAPETQFVKEKEILEKIEDMITDHTLTQGQAPGGQKNQAGRLESGVWACNKNYQPTCDPNYQYR